MDDENLLIKCYKLIYILCSVNKFVKLLPLSAVYVILYIVCFFKFKCIFFYFYETVSAVKHQSVMQFIVLKRFFKAGKTIGTTFKILELCVIIFSILIKNSKDKLSVKKKKTSKREYNINIHLSGFYF